MTQGHARAVLSGDAIPWVERQSESAAQQGKYEEYDISAIADTASVVQTGVPVQDQGNDCSDNDAEIEDGPIDGDIEPFLGLGCVRSDGRGDRGPEKSSRETVPRAAKDDEANIAIAIVRPERGNVCCVARTTQDERRP